ncbi:MAG: hypothetical protein IT317_05285 [Anaerolineales bacterium]|nr:hypothetical protein [Anaerolineales bacterium]
MGAQAKLRRRALAVNLALVLAAGCVTPTPLAPPATAAPSGTPNVSGTATARAVQVAEGLVATLTAVAETATSEAKAEATAASVAGTEAAQAGRTATAQAQATAAAERKAARIAAAQATRAQATAQAQPLAARVEAIVAEGYLNSSAGRYDRLDDFSDAWAQINWYQWLWTGYAPTDFVVRADFAWASASDTANWFNSGCGFVFRETSRENLDHYLVYLGLDGVVYFLKNRLGELTELASARAGRLDVPEGSAQFMLAVEADRFTAYVNDQRVLTAHDGSLKNGLLNYTLLSGTNRDYGTRCEMTNVELWTLDQP